MKADISVNDKDGNVNISVSFDEGIIGKNLTPGNAEMVVKLLSQIAATFCLYVFKNWLLKFECHEDTIKVDEKHYRFKCESSKEFMTYFGKMTLNRRVFQNDQGGKCYIPIDEIWGMVGQYADPKVREAILIMSALGTPEEVSLCVPTPATAFVALSGISVIMKQTGCQWAF